MQGFRVINVRTERRRIEEDVLEEVEYGDFVFDNGTVQKNRMIVTCYRCGQILRPGSINAGEGFHVDGCEGY